MANKIDFNNNIPSAPSGRLNIQWQYDANGNVSANIPTPSSGGVSQIQDEGASLTQRTILNFVGSGVTATDDSVNGRTIITIPGGAGGSQTPWLSNIDANNFNLTYVNKIIAGVNGSRVLTNYLISPRVNLVNTNPPGGATLECTGFGIVSQIALQYANGTEANPTAVLSGNVMANLVFRGFDGSGFTLKRAAISCYAAENWSAFVSGTYMTFETTIQGQNAATERMRINSLGNFEVIGDIIANNKLFCNTDIYIADTAPGTGWFRLDGYDGQFHIVKDPATILFQVNTTRANFQIPLSINGAVTAYGNFQSAYLAGYWFLGSDNATGRFYMSISDANPTQFRFYTYTVGNILTLDMDTGDAYFSRYVNAQYYNMSSGNADSWEPNAIFVTFDTFLRRQSMSYFNANWNKPTWTNVQSKPDVFYQNYPNAAYFANSIFSFKTASSVSINIGTAQTSGNFGTMIWDHNFLLFGLRVAGVANYQIAMYTTGQIGIPIGLGTSVPPATSQTLYRDANGFVKIAF